MSSMLTTQGVEQHGYLVPDGQSSPQPWIFTACCSFPSSISNTSSQPAKVSFLLSSSFCFVQRGILLWIPLHGRIKTRGTASVWITVWYMFCSFSVHVSYPGGWARTVVKLICLLDKREREVCIQSLMGRETSFAPSSKSVHSCFEVVALFVCLFLGPIHYASGFQLTLCNRTDCSLCSEWQEQHFWAYTGMGSVQVVFSIIWYLCVYKCMHKYT